MTDTPWVDGRLPHGYTNLTGSATGIVRKAYIGPEADERLRVERATLTALHGRLPAPAVRDQDDDALYLTEVAGWHAQESLDAGQAEQVLRLCGELRRRLSEVDPATVAGLSGSGAVVVHGDFGPQNLLVDDSAEAVVAV